MKTLTSLVCCALLSFPQQTPIRLSGIVVDSTGKGIEGVLVKVVSDNHDYTTSSGEYNITLRSHVRPGNRVLLQVRKSGYRLQDPADGWITVPENSISNPIKIVLARESEPVAGTPLLELREFKLAWSQSPCYDSNVRPWCEGGFCLGVLAEFRFRSARFNSAPYLRSVDDVLVKDLNRDEFSIHLVPLTSSAILETCIALPKQPDATHSIRLVTKNREWGVRIGSLHWTAVPASYLEGKFATGKVSVVLDDPDWVVLRAARMLPVEETGEELLEVIFENLSGSPIPINNISLVASDDWGHRCEAGAKVPPPQTVVLDGTRISSIGQSESAGGWTQLGELKITINARIQPASCSNYSNEFRAKIPVQLDLEPATIGRITFKVAGTSGLVNNATGHTRNKPLRDWSKFSVEIEEATVRPHLLAIEH